MVLDFEDKTYESFKQRLYYSNFKMGFIGLKYKFYYKVLFMIENIIEILFLMFFIMTNQNDFSSINIKIYGNYFDSRFNKTLFKYSNLDINVGYIFNFLDILNKLTLQKYLIPLIIIIVLMILKFGQFCYYLTAKSSVISINYFKRLFYHVCSLIDQIFKTYGDIITMTISLSMFSCTNNLNLANNILLNYNSKLILTTNDLPVNSFFPEFTCYKGNHIILICINCFILLVFILNSFYLTIFYEPSNIIEKNNFGLSDNTYPYLMLFIGKFILIFFNVFNFSKNQEIIKLGIFIGLMLLSILVLARKSNKFLNLYQDILIIKISFLLIFSLFVILYSMTSNEINLLIFFLTLGSSIIMSYLILHMIFYFRINKLYAREHDLHCYPYILFVLDMIMQYTKNKKYKIILDGFINVYNIEQNELEDPLAKEIHRLINYSTDIEYSDNENILYLNKTYNKNYVTKSNLFINGIFNNGNYIRGSEKLQDFGNKKCYMQRKMLEFLSYLITRHSYNSHHSFLFKLLMTQIYLRKLNNPIRSWFILNNFYETYNKFSIKHRFYIYCMFQELYMKLKDIDTYATHNNSKIKSIIKYEKLNNKFYNKIHKNTCIVREYWNLYLTEKQKGTINSNMINNQLKKINLKFQKLQLFFNEMLKINEDNQLIFYIYSCFLKNVLNNDTSAEYIIKLLKDFKDSNSTKPIIDDEYYKMLNNEEIGLLRVSCNNLETGKIKWCNDKMSSICGFPKFELTKMKINRLIPPIIAVKHNDYIKNFIINPKEIFMNKIRVAIMVNDLNFLFPIVIYLKILPQIKNGIEVVALIHKVLDNTFILYKNPEINNSKICFCLINENGSIEAVDRNANIYLGLPNFVRDGSKLKLAMDNRKCNLFELCPRLKEYIFSNNFRCEIVLDTTLLSEDYYNDENGIFLSINKRIKYLVSQKIPDNNIGLSFNYDYYEDDGVDEGNDSIKEKTIKFKKLQSNNIKNIFREHNIIVDIYNLKSSCGDIKCYLIKFYYIPDSILSITETNLYSNHRENNIIMSSGIPILHFQNSAFQGQNEELNNQLNIFVNEKFKIKKNNLFDEMIHKQSKYFKWMQIMFIFLVVILISIISFELILHIQQVNKIGGLKNILIKFVKRRDLTSNIVLNLLWHLDMSNKIETNARKYQVYNITEFLLLDFLKIDNMNLKKEQNYIENREEFILENNLYNNVNSNYTFFTYTNDPVTQQYKIDIAFNKYISNLDNYFESTSYKLNNTPDRLFYLINPKYSYMNLILTELEKLFLNLFNNGINLIKLSNQHLIDNLISIIDDYSNKIVQILFYLNLSAIFFTLLFSIVLLFMYLKLFSKQDEILKYFIKVDTICTVKMMIMCDKFLMILNHTPNDIDGFRKFYYFDHDLIYEKIYSRQAHKIKEAADSPTLINKMKREKGNNNFYEDTSSKLSNSSQAQFSRRTMSSSPAERKENENNYIDKYTKFLDQDIEEKNKKKLETDVILVNSKNILVKTSLLTLLFCILLSAYFLIVIMIDLNMSDFVQLTLDIFDFQQKRGFYLINSIIFFKHIILSQSNTSLNTFLSFYNDSLINEAKLQMFAMEENYKKYNDILLSIDTTNICYFFGNNTNLYISNNLSRLSTEICSYQDNYQAIIQKSLFEIISILTNNYLIDLYNTYTNMQNKSSILLLTSLIDSPYLQFTQILSQFVVRQSIFVIIDELDTVFQNKMDQYYALCITHCILFLLFVIIVVSVSNLVSFNIFKEKKRRNELIILLLPYEFIRKQIEEEEELRKKHDQEN